MLRPAENKAVKPQENKQELLICSCCRLPFARVENGALVIESQHYGKKHTNVIAVGELVKMVRE